MTLPLGYELVPISVSPQSSPKSYSTPAATPVGPSPGPRPKASTAQTDNTGTRPVFKATQGLLTRDRRAS